MKSKKAGNILLGIALVSICCSLAIAQSFYGSIQGSVTDASGSLMPEAKVTLTNLGTNEKREIETNAEGLYQFVNLIPGRYRIEVEKSGFKHFLREPITVEVQSAVRIDVAGMELGALTQTVEVRAETPLLQPETSSLGQVIESRKVNELPLNGRNPLALVALVPGVVPQGTGTVGGGVLKNTAGQNPFAAGNFQIGGGASNQSAAFWDGGPLNVVYGNQLVLSPTQDSLQEFKVQTNNMSAEFGRFSGGVVNLSTRSGTSQFHGTMYEYLRNKVLNSNTFFNNTAGIGVPAFTQNQFGGSIGGPVKIPHVYHGQDKLFFFTNLERYTQRKGISSVFTVPTATEVNGDFSGLRDAAGRAIPIYDPTTTRPDPTRSGFYIRDLIPNGVIPQNRIDTAARYLGNYHLWAAPNVTGDPATHINNWVGNTSSGADSTQWTTRVDANISNKQRFFGRFTLWDSYLLPVDPFGTGAYAIQVVPQKWWNYQALINDSYSLSPTTILDIRYSYLRQNVDQKPQSLGFDLTKLGWPASANAAVSARTLPVIASMPGMTSFFAETGTPILSHIDDHSLAPSLNVMHGRHSLKFGGDFRVGHQNHLQVTNASGSFNFAQTFTSSDPLHPSGGFAFAAFMLGYPSGGSVTTYEPIAGQRIYRAFYAQDDIHVSRKLTVNVGLRYEQEGPWSERYDRLSFFIPGAPSPVAQASGRTVLGRLALVNSPDRGSRNNINLEKMAFGPRAGFAYQIFANTVLRGGYGLFWLPAAFLNAATPAGDPINSYSTPFVSSNDGGLTPYTRLSNPFPDGIAQPPQRDPSYQSKLLGLGITPVLPSNAYGYAQQWNFNIQQQIARAWLVDAAYAGSRGVHLPFPPTVADQLPPQYMSLGAALIQSVPNPFYGLIQNGNLALPTVTASQLLRPYPQYSAVNYVGRGNGDSVYHSFQLKVERRFASAGSILASYTNAKLISNADSQTGWLEVGSALPQNYYDLRSQRSLAAFDASQRLVVSYVLDLPLGHGKRFFGNAKGVGEKLVSGWGINGVVTCQRGFPLFLTTSQNLTNAFGGNSRPNSNGKDPALSGSPEGRLIKWFDTSVFSQPASFTFGNVGRTLPNVRADGIGNVDFALFKKTTFGPKDRMGVEFRAEFFNLFNHPQFGYPGMSFGTAQFGVVSSQANDPRLVQFALRFSF